MDCPFLLLLRWKIIPAYLRTSSGIKKYYTPHNISKFGLKKLFKLSLFYPSQSTSIVSFPTGDAVLSRFLKSVPLHQFSTTSKIKLYEKVGEIYFLLNMRGSPNRKISKLLSVNLKYELAVLRSVTAKPIVLRHPL